MNYIWFFKDSICNYAYISISVFFLHRFHQQLNFLREVHSLVNFSCYVLNIITLNDTYKNKHMAIKNQCKRMNFQISPLHEIYKRAIKFSKRCTSFSEPVESAFTTVCHVSETFSCPGNVGIAPGNGSFCIVVINIEQNRVEVDASSGCGLFYVGAADVLGLIRDPTGKQVHSLRNLKKIDLISH